MEPRPDIDTLARGLLDGLRQWLSAEPSARPLQGITQAVSVERARATEVVAERYRERTDALRETLVARRDALDADERDTTEDASKDLARRARVLEQTRDLGVRPTAPAQRDPSPPAPRADLDIRRRLRQVRQGEPGNPASGGKGTATRRPSTGAAERPGRVARSKVTPLPVRQIRGVGAALEARLKKAGVTDTEGVAKLSADRLVDVLQISPKRAQEIAEQARQLNKGGR